jgi:glycosyltransferase involved in cell wall biosynthesis
MKSYSDVVTLIPAYNEEMNIEEVVALTKKHLEGGKILVVDDGSKDRTSELAKKAGAIVIRHDVNRGKGESLKTGFEYILKELKESKYIIISDADMQYTPEECPKILWPLLTGQADFVMGARDWSKVPFRHRLGNFVWRTSFNILFGQKMKDTNCGFVAMSRTALEKMSNVFGRYTIDNAMLIDCIKNKLRIAQAPVSVYYKHTSKTARGIRMVVEVWWFIISAGIKYRLKL